MADWEVVIGLEIHAQLATRSKIFSGAATAYGAPPNTQASLVDLAYPGVLPVLNAEAVRMAVKFGLAVGATIAPRSVFAASETVATRLGNTAIALIVAGPGGDQTEESPRDSSMSPRRLAR